jgi:Ni,Fe-hydrogenase I large subunit
MDLAQCTRYIADQDAAFADKLFDACTPAPGVGVARVETARGALLHRVRLADGEKRRDGGKQMIDEYAVVAPTEWNFQPRGAFAAALRGAMATDAGALRGHGLRLALALDPWVAYEVTVEHA